MVESQPSKLLVAGSIPVSRSSLRRLSDRLSDCRPPAVRVNGAWRVGGGRPRIGGIPIEGRLSRETGARKRADVAQLVEHSLGKGEVTGSIPVISSRIFSRLATGFFRNDL